MSKFPGVNETLDLLSRLKSAVSECTACERTLTQQFNARASAETNRHEAAVEKEHSRVADALAAANAAYQTQQEALNARYDHRKARIARGQKSSRKQAQERIELDEGRRKYEVQKGLLETERNRKAELAANDTRAADFRANAAGHREASVALEQDAQEALRGYGRFRRLLEDPGEVAPPDPARDEYQLLEDLEALHAKTAESLAAFRKLGAPALFRLLPLPLLLTLLAVIHAALAPVLRYFQVTTVTYAHAAGSFAVLVVLLVVLYLSGRRKAASRAASIAVALEQGRRLHERCLEKCATRHQQEIERIETEAQNRTMALNQEWDQALEEANYRRDVWPRLLEEKAGRALSRHQQLHRVRLERIEAEHARSTGRLKQESDAQQRQLAEAHRARQAQMDAERETQFQALETESRNALQPLFESVQSQSAGAAAQFPDWQAAVWDLWQPPQLFANAAQFGHLEVDLARLSDGLPQDPRLAVPGPARFALPLLLVYPQQGSILFETLKSGSEAVTGPLNNLLLRLLSQAPPGRLSFTIIDPVKLGQNFAGVMHLADYEENLINNRIWTQSSEIEQRLADLNEHMEKVIQMYLRNEYATITDYNAEAGNIAEKYHFLVVADFPVNFSETAVRRLVNIAASGARCGVYTIIHWDRRQVLPPDFVLDELRRNSVCITCPTAGTFLLGGHSLPGARLVLDAPPAPELETRLLHTVGTAGKNANRVEVPFVQVSPPEGELWTLDTTDELRVPIGRTGATKLQQLAIGRGTRQHALVAGKTGSGKSTLFHVIITNLAMWCDPDQVEFYLVDFKKGVEFKCYASRRLPHARVVAIESDREFGLSVLQRLDEELKRRGDLFRALGVQDVAGFKKAGGNEPIPRSLLIIDEFQEFFVEDDRISQGAAVLLDRIVRQGRAFGIHVLLGSQTLGGAYTLARTTIGQMVIRIALQCNEADAYLIMDDSNPAPRLLSRPGEGIYNDMAGMLEGNSPFQTVWLPDEEREACLDRIRALADQSGRTYTAPFVFEGNAPADVRENQLLRALLETPPTAAPSAARLWLGAPNSIKGPTEAVIHRQSGNHVLLVGQRDEAALAILSVGLLALAAQYPRTTARFILLDSTPPGSPARDFLQRVTQAVPHEMIVARGGELAEILGGLVDDMKRRADEAHGAESPATFLFIYGLQNFKKLRQEEDFSFSVGSSEATASPAALLGELITGGAAMGLHVIATCDTYNNVNRYLGRKALSEFEMRVLFQMSANDSASLIDNPKASTLGLHRALFYNEQEGYLETFRPYALPTGDWLEAAAKALAR